MKLQFCGATKTVTGSCHYLDTGYHKILVDCGMFQGREVVDNNLLPFPFNPAEIEYVFLTHSHVDHCGRLPVLVKQGFHGRIICTRATKELTRILLEDSAKLQEEDFTKCERQNREDCEAKHLYSPEDVETVMQYFDTYPYGDSIKLDDGFEFRMRDAGHILGSSIFEIWSKNGDGRTRKLVFSGDLGQPGQRIVRDPDLIREADYVIMETTYGNRLHKSKDETMVEFLKILKDAQRENGNVLVPSFAVERAQEILYEFNLFVENKLIENVQVFFDSPLAKKATDIFRRHIDLYDEDARRLIESGDDLFNFPGLQYVSDIEESRRLAARKNIVIIAGSGMCTGGRILSHLQNNVSDPKNHLVITGYQVKGTLGREFVDGVETVNIKGKPYEVKLQVHTLGGLSAHGDKGDLAYWLQGFGKYPKKVFLVHGDEDVINVFADEMRREASLDIEIPDLNEVFELD